MFSATVCVIGLSKCVKLERGKFDNTSMSYDAETFTRNVNVRYCIASFALPGHSNTGNNRQCVVEMI